MVVWFMERFRGNPGFIGRLVAWADVRWLRRTIADVTRMHERM